jgi:membrane protein DedA with SNARE-associated domain
VPTFGSFPEVIAGGALLAAYASVFLLVAGDAIVPMLPGETTLSAAAVLAAVGVLDLRLVILAGALGAIGGDTAAYWIGRTGRGPVQRALVRAAGVERLGWAEGIFRRRRLLFIVFGRYVPVGRVVVNLTAGRLISYRRFLPASALAGLIWSAQGSLIAYFIGRIIDQPLVALIVAVLASAAVFLAVAVLEREAIRRIIGGGTDRDRDNRTPNGRST